MRVVIPAAGMGSRMGRGVPKALIEVGGKPLIQWQLEAIPPSVPVSVVVGFRGDDVLRVIERVRPSVYVCTNSKYRSTGVVHSVGLGLEHSNELVVVLDGDVMVLPRHLQPFLSAHTSVIGIRPTGQGDIHPVFVSLRDEKVIAFSRRKASRSHEWACICTAPANIFYPKDAVEADYCIYHALKRILPAPCVVTDAIELDTPEDITRAEERIVKWRS